MHLNDIRDAVHQTAREKGWWDDTPEMPLRTVGDTIALMHSELSEALEEYRAGHEPNEVYYASQDLFASHRKPEGVPIELADVIIRICDFAGRHNIDLDSAVYTKMKYNETRSARHGGKVL